MKSLTTSLIIAAFLFISSTVYSETVEVIAENFRFVPAEVTIKAGDTIKWIIKGTFHSTTSGTKCTPDGNWDSTILTFGEEYSKEFNKPGVYPYFCTPHCEGFNMLGTVTVVGK